MNSYSRAKKTNVLTPAVMLTIGAVLTIAVIFGIKFLMWGDAGEAPPSSPAQEAIFRDERPAGAAAGLLPASRSETSSGGSLDMFAKANEGYSEEDPAPAAAAKQAAPAVPEAAPAAPEKKAAKKAGNTRQGEAIPRLKGFKPFNTAAPGKQGTKGGAAMPDMAEMMKQARQNQGSGD
ncbi:MAG: hypothetical protein HY550_05435 [Elusimicrobia bacterium]|nr:hypothetical protein [Elusimicrobiota bacterium]